ncbi:Uncharacterised protein [Klebsiella pneumoniae]|nr:Uncharacterised protein [Klebsiella pneumoniae]
MLEYFTCEFIHTCCSCRTGRTNHFITYRINRTNVVNKFTFKINR